MRRPLSESLHAVRVMLAALCCMVTAEVQMLLQMLLCDSKEDVSPGWGGFRVRALEPYAQDDIY